MKKNNSNINLALAIFLLVTSIMSILGTIFSHLAILLIPAFSSLKPIFAKGDYIFYLMAWTMLHSYMIVLSIEWIRGKSVKKDIVNTLYLMVGAGIWGVIRGPITAGIYSLVLYAVILYYIHKIPAEKLIT